MMTTVQELEVTVTSHIDVCAVRYEGIATEMRGVNARLKRMERTIISVGGAVIVILLGALGTIAMMLLEALQKGVH
jgi:hypothetical protein